MNRVVICIFFLLVGCEPPSPPEEGTKLEHQTESLIHKIKDGNLEILEMEGCEYILYKGSVGANHAYGYMAHKGNCKNPIHCYHYDNSLPDTVKQENADGTKKEIK